MSFHCLWAESRAVGLKCISSQRAIAGNALKLPSSLCLLADTNKIFVAHSRAAHGACDIDAIAALDEVQGLQLDHQLCIERRCFDSERQLHLLSSPKWDGQHLVRSVSSSEISWRRRTWPLACICPFQAFCGCRSVRPIRRVSGLRMINSLRLARMAHLVVHVT